MGDLSKSKWSSTNFGYELWDKIEEDGLLLMSPPRTVVVMQLINWIFIFSYLRFSFIVFLFCVECVKYHFKNRNDRYHQSDDVFYFFWIFASSCFRFGHRPGNLIYKVSINLV